MAKIDKSNLELALTENNKKMRQYVYDVITQFSPTAINAARILSHLSNITIHVTRAEKELWNSTYERAKQYMDDTFKDITSIDLKVVDTLPTTNISSNSIYLVKEPKKTREYTTSPTEDEVYTQYVYADGKWVSLGKTSVDMSNYYNKDEVDKLVQNIMSTAKHSHENQDILDLITAAFTTEDKLLLQSLRNTDTEGIATHINNEDIHLSQNEKRMLSELMKLNLDEIVAHLDNKTIHLNQEQCDTINTVLGNANQYTDQKIEKMVVIKSVESLPLEPDENTIYLVPNPEPVELNTLDKYIYTGGRYEQLNIGDVIHATVDPDTPDPIIPPSVDLGAYCTTIAMQTYVNQKIHTHARLDILEQMTAAFTTELRDKLNATANSLTNHQGSASIHLSTDQIALLDKIRTLDNTIDTRITNILNEKNNPETSLHVKWVGCLPEISEASLNTLYIVKPVNLSDTVTAPSADGGIGTIKFYRDVCTDYTGYIVAEKIVTDPGTNQAVRIRRWETVYENCELTDTQLSTIINNANA